MNITDFLSPERVDIDVAAASKLQLLHALSKSAANALRVKESDVFRALNNRELLGSTGIGEGIAVPHAPVPGISTPLALLVRLKRAIDFEAIDGMPVDIVFCLLTPAENRTHLAVLATVARALHSVDVRKSIRAALTAEELYLSLVGTKAQEQNAAACAKSS
ncbi:PTS sugar transporter subunit IIA [Mycoplana rhizolycopersici]|uniref:PTS sugar transporter subunit IIA n=1 Tax=Mycoplana rhizolycopersici TaxID=2746702 RepID=A0ABX2QKK3_9HYPH|nr:PTS sugar transporter subunit IIA [Rhizobium rhizolycopersici]NVP58267.1 PTS sugar transporter subunit IIA [Rhizobium rhizolycopersici]